MSGLVLVSHPLCPYVQRAAIALAEKGMAFTRRDVDLGAKPDWFLALSPLGKVPLLQVDGEVIFESAVILEYLEETLPHPLHPADPLERARHRGWIEFASAGLAGIARLYGAKTGAAFEAEAAALRGGFVRVEAELDRGTGPWFGGAEFALVDAVFGPVFRYFDAFEALAGLRLLDGLPRVAAWRAALAARPSVRGAVAPDYPARLEAFLKARGSVLSELIAGRAAA